MLGAIVIMLSWPIALAMTLPEAKPSAGMELWSDMHATMDTDHIHTLVRRLSSDLKHVNITSPKVYLYEDVENYKREHNWLPLEDLEFEDIDKRGEIPAGSIRCTKPGCAYNPSLGIGKFSGKPYRNTAGNAFCRFVLSIAPNKAGMIGFVGYHATCAKAEGDNCSVRFQVAVSKGTLGSEIAGNYANCVDAVQAVYAACDLKCGGATCGSNANPKSFLVEVQALTVSDAKCENSYCKQVDCLRSADC